MEYPQEEIIFGSVVFELSSCVQRNSAFSVLFAHPELPTIFLDFFATSYQHHKLLASEPEYSPQEITFGSVVIEISTCKKHENFGGRGFEPRVGDFFFFFFALRQEL
jgi:hypothetical protein